MVSKDDPRDGMRSRSGKAVAQQAPVVARGVDRLCRVTGTFYRAVDGAHRMTAIDGSRLSGRYSAAGQPTLYLSSSPEGVAAAMVAHGGGRANLALLAFNVQAENVFDLRDRAALRAAGVDLQDAVAPWHDVVATGGRPRSWDVRRRLEDVGAEGLIDPSRTRPGLWHLVLFRWNTATTARVEPLDP